MIYFLYNIENMVGMEKELEQWVMKGEQLFAEKKFPKAIDCYDKALELGSNNFLVLLHKALALFDIGWFDESLIWFDKAFEVNPDYKPTWFIKGHHRFVEKRHQKALDCYDKALELEPNKVHAWVGKARSYRFLFNFPMAEKSSDKALELNPNDPFALFQKASAVFCLGKAEESIIWFDKAIEVNPDLNGFWNTKGWVLIRLRKYQEALNCLDKAIELNPHDYFAWTHKAELYERLMSYDKALECITNGVNIVPNHPTGLSKMGWNLILVGKIPDALEHLDKSLLLNPNDAYPWYHKGFALSKLGRYEEAVKCYDNALEVIPETPSYGYLNLEEFSEEIKEARATAYEYLHKIDSQISLRKEFEKKYEMLKEHPPDPQITLKAYVGESPYVFISYSHKDSTLVQSQMEWMTKNGFNIWFDAGIPLGSNWVEEIVKALENCSVFIVFITKNSLRSKFVNKEVITAVDKNKYILPIHLEPTDIRKDWQFMFADLQQINSFDMNEQVYRNEIVKVFHQKMID
jgi:tetratricopeptide (TPR) repeat protein